MRLAGRFLLFSEDKPASKKYFEIFSKKEAFSGQRTALPVSCWRKGTEPQHPPQKGGEKMEAIPRDYGEQCRFDAFCKTVLRNEARNYHRDMKRQRDRETSFSVLPQAELDKLYTVDHYPSDDFVFSSHGYDLHIDNELVAAAFAELSQQAQSILILHCVLELADGEIGALMGMSRSAVQRHRTKTLKELRTKLMALMPEGG